MLSQEPKAAIMPKYGTSCSVALPTTKENHTKNKVTVKATLFIDNLCPCGQNIYLKQGNIFRVSLIHETAQTESTAKELPFVFVFSL